MLVTFKLIIRSMRRRKLESFINAIGMGLGLAGFLLISAYIRHETSYDKFHERGDRIYRIIAEVRSPQDTTRQAPTPAPWAPALRDKYPEIEKASRVYFSREKIIAAGEKRFYESRIIFADPDFFDIFTFPVVRGKARNLLADPQAIVLTESAAGKYFGAADPLGKTLMIDNAHAFIVTGVVRDVPPNSHFHFDFVASYAGPMEKISGLDMDQWYAYFVQTYILARPGFSPRLFEDKIQGFAATHAPRDDGIAVRPLVQPIAAIHLNKETVQNVEPSVSPASLAVILLVGAFILVIAAINFVNLSIARAFRRIKEVGVRKVSGAGRGRLARQFLLESVLQTYLGLVLAVFLVTFVRPLFTDLVQKDIPFVLRPDLLNTFLILGFPLLLGFAAGLYPALLLSRQRPADTMKGVLVVGRKRRPASGLRGGLVAVQFAISTVLIIGSVFIQKQHRHMVTADMGFQQDAQVLIRLPENRMSADRLALIKSKFGRHPSVEGITAGFGNPIGNAFVSNVYAAENANPINAVFKFVDADFISHFDLKLSAGRGFSPDNPGDAWKTFVINESLARSLGHPDPDTALEKQFRIGINNIQGRVIGVLKDFRTDSVYVPIQPTVMLYAPQLCTETIVRVRPGQVSSALAHLQTAWSAIYPLHPFLYTFLDDDIRNFYVREERSLKLVGVSAAMAILISCLGLFGLALFEAARRVREIGIRKVLGASVRQVVFLQARGFVRLVMWGNLLAWPAAYLILRRWLQNFSLRISLGPGPFVLALFLTVSIALLTIGVQAVRAALANPRECLRYE